MLDFVKDSLATKRTLTANDVAARLKVSRWTVGRWVRLGELDCVRLSLGKRAHIRVTESQLARFLDSHSGHYLTVRGRR